MNFDFVATLLMSDAGHFFIAGCLAFAVLAIAGLFLSLLRSLKASRALIAEAAAKLQSAAELADEVRALRERVESSIARNEEVLSDIVRARFEEDKNCKPVHDADHAAAGASGEPLEGESEGDERHTAGGGDLPEKDRTGFLHSFFGRRRQA